jgi:hypothetical protein
MISQPCKLRQKASGGSRSRPNQQLQLCNKARNKPHTAHQIHQTTINNGPHQHPTRPKPGQQPKTGLSECAAPRRNRPREAGIRDPREDKKKKIRHHQVHSRLKLPSRVPRRNERSAHLPQLCRSAVSDGSKLETHPPSRSTVVRLERAT